MNHDKFSVKIIGIVFNPKTRKILVGKNIEDEKYTFLEGFLSYNEELDVGLKKVANEKTGYKVANLGAVFARNCCTNKKDRLYLYFLCEVAGGKEKLGKDIKELKWIKPSEVEKALEEKLPTRLREYILGLE